MASIYGAKSSTGWQLRLDYSVSQSIADNKSTLSLTLYIYDGTGESYNLDANSCYYTLQGTKVYNPYRYNSRGWYKLGSKSITVAHNNMGKGSVVLSADWHSGFTSSYTPSSLTVSGTVNLPDIPRASSVSASLTLGSAGTITVNRAVNTFTHTIKLKCGSAAQVTIAEKSTATSITYTPPIEWASQNTAGTTVNITAEVTTYNGNTVVGTVTNTLKASIPASVKPTLSVALSDTAGYQSAYGWVQGKSVLKATYTASGSYGSTIVSKALTIGGKAASADGGNALQNTGTMAVVATVTDSRGRTASVTQNITVNVYSGPGIQDLTFLRGDYSGGTWTDNAMGDDIKLTFTLSIQLTGNKATVEVTGASNLTGQTSGAKTVYLVDYGTDSTGVVQVKATDALGGTVTREITIPTVSVPMNMSFTLPGVCFGGVAEKEKTVEFKWPIHYMGKALLDLLHPVGSIFQSTDATSPADLFGGTWEQVKDVFLLAAGDSHEAGSTGGEETHTLTKAEIPDHNHTFKYTGQSVTEGVNAVRLYQAASNQYNAYSGGQSSDCGDQAHNNMPPYLAVYTWRRTA
nr:MAG TPA: baseplate wedge protein [Caudoviricetes sp.]